MSRKWPWKRNIRVFYEHIAPGYFDALCAGGWLAVEIGCAQGRAVSDIFTAAGYRRIQVRKDLAGKDRVVLGQKPEMG